MEEEEIDSQTIWYLNLLVEITRGCPGDLFLDYRKKIDNLLEKISRIKSKHAFTVSFK